MTTREVGSLGPGVHTVELGAAREFPSGMYFLRLTQAERTAGASVVIRGSGGM